jgi:Gamma-glutamyl cyclotransferase, AIG2-like
MRTIDVFFYGLFIDEDLLRAKGVRVTAMRPASVQGFELRIGNRATLVLKKSSRVFGMVASLTHAELERLYSESSVQAYRPEALLTQLANGETIAALCFNLVEPPAPDERNPEYAAKLRALAERLKFPRDYVASIQ